MLNFSNNSDILANNNFRKFKLKLYLLLCPLDVIRLLKGLCSFLYSKRYEKLVLVFIGIQVWPNQSCISKSKTLLKYIFVIFKG